MTVLTNRQELIIEAFSRGYYIDDNGDVFNKNNKMVGFLTPSGYKVISFRKDKTSVSVFIHRMQAYKKYGDDIFKEGIVVRHLNGVSTDNSIYNIVIGTHSDNMNDKPVEVRRRIASCGNKKYNHKNIIEDRKFGMSYKQLMEKYDISSKGTISFIINKSMELTIPAT